MNSIFGQFWFAQQLGWPWWTPLAASAAFMVVGVTAFLIAANWWTRR